ncbi:hypothetical protein SCAR479_13377 [Seiridium cardinale]|uniref:Uncharacterized protein n=1 Tax=Seiridium cardinale TaxID=138064 RepID=A0ABR2X8D2_9PEZI
MSLNGERCHNTKLATATSHGDSEIRPGRRVDVEDRSVRRNSLPSNDVISRKPVLSAEEGDTTLKEVPADTDYVQTSADDCHIVGFKLASHIVPGALQLGID